MGSEQLLVRIDATTEQLRRELRQADQTVQRTSRNIDQRLKRVDSAFRRLRGVLGPLVGVAGVSLLGRFSTQTLQSVSSLKQQADAAGLGVEQFQELTKGFRDLGNITESTTAGALRRFQRRFGLAMEDTGAAVDTLDRLNITLEQDTTSALEEAIRKLADIERGSERAAAASQLFGEDAGPALAGALGEGSEALEDIIHQLRESGRIMGEDFVDSADELDQKWNELTDTINTNFQRAIINSLDLVDDLITSTEEANRSLTAGQQRQQTRSERGGPGQPDVLQDEIRRLREQQGTTGTRRGAAQDLDRLLPRARQNLFDRTVDDGGIQIQVTPDFPTMSEIEDAAEQSGFRNAFNEAVPPVKITPEVDSPDLDALQEDLTLDQLGLGSIDMVPDTDFDQLQEDMERMNELTARRDRLLRQVETPQERFNRRIEEMRELLDAGVISMETFKRGTEQASEQLERAKDQADETGDEMSKFAEQAASNMQDAFADFLFDPFSDGLDGMLDGFIQTARRMAAEAASQQVLEGLFGGQDGIGNTIDSVLGAFSGGGGKGKGGGGGFGAAIGSFFGGFFADGGRPPMGQASVVGERGPELFVPQTPGQIVSNEDAQEAVRSGARGGGRMETGGKQVVVNQTVNTPDAQSFQRSSQAITRELRRGAR